MFKNHSYCTSLYCPLLKMPVNSRLTTAEKNRILAGLVEGLMLLELAKELQRDKRTLVSIVIKPTTNPRKDKGSRRSITGRYMRRIWRQIVKQPNGTSTSIFE